jgi:hypothetical protein
MSQPVGAILSTWALHDLGSEASTSAVYRKCKFVLPLQGILLNGDFIKPEGATFEYEPGRFPAKRHIEIFTITGGILVLWKLQNSTRTAPPASTQSADHPIQEGRNKQG